jgi:hypothetical protein
LEGNDRGLIGYSKPFLIWNEGKVIRINEAKGSPTRQNKFRTQINGKFNDISSADENK